MAFQTRSVRAEDLNLVFDSWMKSWRGSKYAGTIPNQLYYETQRTLIEGLIVRGAKIIVAHPENRDDVILGWACGEEKSGQTVLHFCYVKDPYLVGFGIQARLISDLPGTKPGFVTHWQNLKETKSWKHVPEMARRMVL